MGTYFAAFKAYDVRGIVPSEINPDLAYRISGVLLSPTQLPESKTICRSATTFASADPISTKLAAKGLNDAGVDVVHLGMVATEMVYFATAKYGYDGGVMITASHNPPEYNGMKFVRAESRPISGMTPGLKQTLSVEPSSSDGNAKAPV